MPYSWTTFIINNTYLSLQLKCKYESNGCHKICTKEEVKRHQSICKFNNNLISGCDKGCGDLIKDNQISSHYCVNYLKDIIGEKNRELTKSYDQIHSQKESMKW